MTNRFFILSIAIVLSGIAVTVISNHTVSAADNYKGPLDLAATKDGSKIYVALFDAHEIAVLNAPEDKIVQTISVGKEPTGIVLSPDEKTLYVTSGGDRGLVQAVDLATGHVVYEVVAGHTPMSPVITPDGKKMFVCNRFNNDVGEYDLPELKCVRRINMIREPRGAVITNDGKTVYVVNALPNDVLNIPEDFEAMIDAAAEVSAIDVVSGTVKNIRLPNGSGNLQGICISPDGRYVYLTEVLGRYMMPATQIERGWMNTNAISILDTTQLDTKHSGLINTVLIDDVDLGAANLWGITVSDDGKQLFITAAGINELIIVDAEAMHKKLSLLPQEDLETIRDPTVKRILFNGVPNDLAFLAGMKKRVRLDGKGARPVVAVGNNVYVGIYYSDTLQKIDLTVSENPDETAITVSAAKSPKTSKTSRISYVNFKRTEIALGNKLEMETLTKERRGEIHWNDATLSLQHWQSCATCHPDGRMNGFNRDLMSDGLGNPKDVKSLLLSKQCLPMMWEGVHKTSALCIRNKLHMVHFFNPDKFHKSQYLDFDTYIQDIDAYIDAMQPVPSPYLVDGKLSERAERGKKIFEDTKIGCAQCHPAPLFTDQKLHNVNTKCFYDRKDSFDTPTLVETWRTAPYLHDGRYTNMKDLFKKGKHGNTEGNNIESLTEEELDDLIEYVLSL